MKPVSKTLLISSEDQKTIMAERLIDAIDVVETALYKKAAGEIVLPEKISIIFDEKAQNRINCMPGALLKDKIYGVKWVSVYPENPKWGLSNVSGTLVLSELDYGQTLSVMDAGYLTEIRTAAVGAVAAKFLSRENSESIGFIGAGHQARRHLDLIKVVRPSIKKCYVSSRTDKTVSAFIKEESILFPDVDFIPCGHDYESAVRDSDIIVTAISGQEDILKAHWIKEGALYIHVAGWEDEYAVALKADKIVCDDWESVKHRTQTISRMYREGLLTDDDIYGNLVEIVSGKKVARTSEKEFIYFCSVGLAYIDVNFAHYFYNKGSELNLGLEYAFN